MDQENKKISCFKNQLSDHGESDLTENAYHASKQKFSIFPSNKENSQFKPIM